jgi:hypothetical protein
VLSRNVQSSWTIRLVFFLLVAPDASAEIFSHQQGAEHFETSVSADRVVVKERYQGATTIYARWDPPYGPPSSPARMPACASRLLPIDANTRDSRTVRRYTQRSCQTRACLECVLRSPARTRLTDWLTL